MFIVNDCLIGGDVVGRSKSITIGLETTIWGLGSGVEIWVVLGKNSSWTSTRTQLSEKGSQLGIRPELTLRFVPVQDRVGSLRPMLVFMTMKLILLLKKAWHSILTPSADSARGTFP